MLSCSVFHVLSSRLHGLGCLFGGRDLLSEGILIRFYSECCCWYLL